MPARAARSLFRSLPMSINDIRKSLNILTENYNDPQSPAKVRKLLYNLYNKSEDPANVEAIIKRLRKVRAENFWDVVAAIGWGTITTEYDDIETALNTIYSETQIDKVHKQAEAYRKQLRKVIDAYEREHNIENFFNESDDGWWDVVAHIVGLGKEVYEEGLRNPASLQGMEDKAVENFEYSLNAWY